MPKLTEGELMPDMQSTPDPAQPLSQVLELIDVLTKAVKDPDKNPDQEMAQLWRALRQLDRQLGELGATQKAEQEAGKQRDSDLREEIRELRARLSDALKVLGPQPQLVSGRMTDAGKANLMTALKYLAFAIAVGALIIAAQANVDVSSLAGK